MVLRKKQMQKKFLELASTGMLWMENPIFVERLSLIWLLNPPSPQLQGEYSAQGTSKRNKTEIERLYGQMSTNDIKT